jgi:hypothetical protein
MHLSTGHARTCLVAVTGAFDMHPSASTQTHVAAEPKYTYMFNTLIERHICFKGYIMSIATKNGGI